MMKCMRGICYGKMAAEGGGEGGGNYECWSVPFCMESCFPCWVCFFCVGHVALLEMEAVKTIPVIMYFFTGIVCFFTGIVCFFTGIVCFFHGDSFFGLRGKWFLLFSRLRIFCPCGCCSAFQAEHLFSGYRQASSCRPRPGVIELRPSSGLRERGVFW